MRVRTWRKGELMSCAAQTCGACVGGSTTPMKAAQPSALQRLNADMWPQAATRRQAPSQRLMPSAPPTALPTWA